MTKDVILSPIFLSGLECDDFGDCVFASCVSGAHTRSMVLGLLLISRGGCLVGDFCLPDGEIQIKCIEAMTWKHKRIVIQSTCVRRKEIRLLVDVVLCYFVRVTMQWHSIDIWWWDVLAGCYAAHGPRGMPDAHAATPH